MTTPSLTFLPSLGMSGFYSLAAPYDKLISASAQYRCEGIQSLSAAVADGQDPLKIVYKANGDTEANFQKALADGVSLITISATSGRLIVFPSNALLMVPLADGVPYRNTILSVALGALPEAQDLSELQSEILAMVQAKYGIRSAAYVSTVGSPDILTRQQHEQVLAARASRITDGESLIAKNARLTAERDALQAKLDELNEYILTTV